MLNPLFGASLAVGFETLRANPLRTILSTLGIVIGVAALVAVLSVGDGMERLARQQIGQTTDLQRIAISARNVRIVDGTPIPTANPVTLGLEDANALRAVADTDGTVNVIRNAAALVTTPGDTATHAAQVTGMLAPAQMIPDSLFLAGHMITDAEGASGAPVVVVSYKLARAVAHGRPPALLVGDTLLFQGQPRRVVGVLRAQETDRGGRAYMPVGAMDSATIAMPGTRSAMLALTARRLEGVAPLEARVERWAAQRFGRDWKDRVAIATDEARLDQVSRGLLLFKLFMGALMSISLIVGGIGIMNVLLSSVIERTREIGIRKAAGAAQRHILWQFLGESVAITGVGSVAGLVLGVTAAFSVTAIMRHVAHAPVRAWLSVSTVLVAMGASIAVGLAFGLYPALRAARLSPIDAIHHE